MIGVMGPGATATVQEQQQAYELGRGIAQRGWVLLTGGRNVGVMDAANRGAKQAQGVTVGILPDGDRHSLSTAVDIPIITDMGSARNNINVLSSDVVVACGMGPGTASEVALAIKNGKPVVLLNQNSETQAFFTNLSAHPIAIAITPADAILLIQNVINANP